MPIGMQKSSGNVFRDLGLRPAEAANLRIRADLMLEVRRLMKERRLTQVRAAHVFGVTQPRISNLAQGKIALFSIDALVKMLAKAGERVHLSLPHSRVA